MRVRGDWRGTGLLVVLALCGCKGQYKPYTVVGVSMSPLLQAGDKIMADQSPAARTGLHDGDVILMRHGAGVVIKRILALPGETISEADRKVFRDGRQVAEPYLAPPSTADTMPELLTFASRKMEPDEMFVMGDNRDHSLDSRMPNYGPVRLEDVVGQYRFTYFKAQGNQK